MKTSLIFIIRCYQKVFSPDTGVFRDLFAHTPLHCAMYPSCSEYMILSIEKLGAFRGLGKGVYRIFRCHPFQKEPIDFP
jgi:putative membrane protein insertion efficiency factor